LSRDAGKLEAKSMSGVCQQDTALSYGKSASCRSNSHSVLVVVACHRKPYQPVSKP
jgi:hypothetical protein